VTVATTGNKERFLSHEIVSVKPSIATYQPAGEVVTGSF
jgi:hypothetical protein